MKWIGQHIWDFISRFRSDVYLEGTETGTIASGGNLGLDSNNKIVKATGVSSSSTVTVTDSDASTAFPIVFHDESNALLDDTQTFTYNPNTKHLGIIGGTPSLTLTENSNDSNDAHLSFYNSRNLVNDGVDGDDLGTIVFYGNDDGTPTQTTFAQFKAEIEDASNTDEAGKIALTVASEGTLRQALTATGDGASSKVDIGLGYGMGSTTTTTGGLTVNGLQSKFTNAITSQVIIENTGNNTAGGILDFLNTRSSGIDGDAAGLVRFYGSDDGGNGVLSCQMEAKTVDTADGAESGGFSIDLKTASGTALRNMLTGDSSASDVVDIGLGYGTASMTTIAGDLNPVGRIRRTLKITDGAAAGEYDGDVVYTGSTTGMTVGECYYYTNAGQWALTNASAEATATGLLAIALGAESDVHGMLLRGMVTTAGIAGTPDEGAKVHLRGTNGALTTDSASSGQFHRIVGYCMENSNSRIYFNPDNTWVELA